MNKDYPEFSAKAVTEGYWELYHDDDCGGIVIEGRCRLCGMRPDLQSLGAQKTCKELKDGQPDNKAT